MTQENLISANLNKMYVQSIFNKVIKQTKKPLSNIEVLQKMLEEAEAKEIKKLIK